MKLWLIGLCGCLLMTGCRSVPKAADFNIASGTPLYFLDTDEKRDSRINQFIETYPEYNEQHKIQYLLQAIQSSPYYFHRNGSQYDSSAAMRWLRWKIQKGYYDAPLDTAWDFIRYVANGSRATGKKYKVVFPGKVYVDLDDVLSNELKLLEEKLSEHVLHTASSMVHASTGEGIGNQSSMLSMPAAPLPAAR